jgi:hypothetical protein
MYKGEIMKRLVNKIIITLALSSFSLVLANSGPVYWQGYPSSDIMTIDKNSPIEVKSENLAFDFSNENNDSYSVTANVTADYVMTNPTNETHSVKMAFPFIERLNNINFDDIKITSDGKELPYEVYLGKSIKSQGNISEENKEENFEFEDIVNTISNNMYESESFKPDEIGKLYHFEIKPTTSDGVEFEVDFVHDHEKTNILINNFNSFSRNDKEIKIASGCYESQVAEIYVLGEDIDFSINGYTIGSTKEVTDSFTYKIIEKEIDVKTYLLDYINNYYSINFESISDTQIYNLYASSLDKYFVNNMGLCSEHDIFDESYKERIISLVYAVEFLPTSDKKVCVSYKSNGTMDKRNTASPKYIFNYILNPAENWNSFKNLNIKIITPEEAPYIIENSIDLLKEEGNIYTASLESLPEEDLAFTLYSNEKVTLFDKIEGQMYRNFGYFTPIVVGIIGIFIIIISIIITKKLIKKSRK